jgi:PAS domain S-box-containing protein
MLEQQEKNAKQGYSSDYGRYKTLFESINAAAFITNLEGNILEANLKSCDLFGYVWEEFNNMPLKNIFLDDTDWPQLLEEITSKGGMNFESSNKRKDGSTFPVVIDTSLFPLDGNPVMLVLVWDITERKRAEEKLRASEERYRCIFENSAVSIMLTDEHENIISWNKYTETLLGYGEDELKNKPVKMLYPEEEWQKIRSENVRQKGMQHHLETKMYGKNGELVDVDISLSVLKDENGNVTGSIGVVKNITERKKAERLIRESEEKFRGLFECSTDGMIILDARGEILDVNSQTLEFFGLSKEKMMGSNFLNMGLLTPKSMSIVVNQFQDLLFNKIATSQETEVIDKDGKVVDVELSSFFLVKKDNEVNNFVLLIRDIRDRKQAEIKLSHEHGLLQTLMDSIPDSIYFKDEKNRFVKVNKAKAAHSNVKPEDMVGKTDFDFLPEEEAKKAFEDDEDVLKTGKFIINKIEKLTSVDGAQRWVSVTKIPRFDAEGNIIGTMGISRDVTEWKKLEEIQNKEKNS